MRWIEQVVLERESQRRLLVGLCLAAAVALVTRGLWSTPLYFQADDSILHLYRTFALDQVLRQGVVYPRWFPFLAYGYGYPIFNYYPILPTYFAESWHVLGLGFVEAVKATFILSLIIAATGAFAMGAELFDDHNPQLTGLLVAVGFLFFPYSLINLYLRGTNEILGAALLPWLIWALRRLRVQPSAGALLLVASLVAMLILGHSLTLFLAAPVLVLFTLFDLQSAPRESRLKILGAVSAATILGAALAAIYWLPMMTEMSQVRIGNGIEAVDEAFRTSFLPATKLVQTSLFYEYGPAPFALGLVPAILGVIGAFVALIVWRDSKRRTVLLFAAIAFLAAIAMTEPARGLWLALPMTTKVQFVWRASVLVGLGLAVTIGAFPATLSRWLSSRLPNAMLSSFQATIVLAFSIMIVGSAFWTLKPEELSLPRGDISPARLAQLEVFTQNAGTTTWGEYLPQAVQVSNFLGYKATSGAPVVAPHIDLSEYGATRRILSVASTTPTSMLLHTFHSPDWQATLDGAPVALYASTPLALQTIDIPAGNHRVELSLINTWPRWVGGTVSGLAALMVLGLAVWAMRRRGIETMIALAFLTLGAFAFALPTSVALAAQPAPLQRMSLDVTPSVQLIGLKVPEGSLDGDVWRIANVRSSLHLTAYWHAHTARLTDTPIFWRLVDEAGRERVKRGQLPRYGTEPQQSWQLNEIVEDDHDLNLAGVPRGRYILQVAYGEQATFLNVAQVQLEKDGLPPVTLPGVTHRVDARLGNQIRLVGYNAPLPPIPGSRYGLDFVWMAERDIYENYTVFVQLLDEDGKLVAQHDSLPGEGLNPSTLWLADVPVEEHRYLDLPPELEPGAYRLVGGLYRFRDMQRLAVETMAGPSPDDQVELGILKIPMNAQAAVPGHSLNISLGSNMRLLGYDTVSKGPHGNVVSTSTAETLTVPGALQDRVLELKLYWQALDHVDRNYKVFVHVLNDAGQVVAQRDQMPGKNRYPTQIWDKGEQVVDPYAIPLNLPSGRYTIFAGMYDPASGERLVVRDGNSKELPDRQVMLSPLEIVEPK